MKTLSGFIIALIILFNTSSLLAKGWCDKIYSCYAHEYNEPDQELSEEITIGKLSNGKQQGVIKVNGNDYNLEMTCGYNDNNKEKYTLKIKKKGENNIFSATQQGDETRILCRPCIPVPGLGWFIANTTKVCNGVYTIFDDDDFFSVTCYTTLSVKFGPL